METQANKNDSYISSMKIKPDHSHSSHLSPPQNLLYPSDQSKQLDPIASTLLSPCSKYTVSQLVDSAQILVSTFVFSHWDNILGPRVEQVWFNGEALLLDQSTLLQICKQGLAGELCRDLSSSITDWRIHTIPDKNVAAVVFVFSANGTNGLSLHSFTLIIQLDQLEYFLHLSDLIYSWISRMVGKLRVLLEKDSRNEALSVFTSYLCNFTEMLLSLSEAKLPTEVEVDDSILCPSHSIEEDFLRTMISSHLMTFGRSVVIGKHIKQVNLEPGSKISHLMKDMLTSKYPSSIIDLNLQRVLQTPDHSSHETYRQEMLKNELICLHYDDNYESYMKRKSFVTVTDCAESFVKTLRKELLQLPRISSGNLCGVWESHINNFLWLLQRKALCLIKYVEQETNRGSHPLNDGIHKLRQDLGLTLEADLRIVLAAADKLKPGIYSLVISDGRRQPDHFGPFFD
ncbi:guanine nucleotide exchange C9orf72-like isoform X2 [Octopus sinensis]|uniref:Guanine nucleotide exchange C9orf72-like isoform X2 n=1 Tax=Octopus sinensis TaxID=2607531 RepID=A0A7E6F1D3_9MOLL|nr:guanine nucleotide exchange C9orf72-like isoform X2 [Octopus sinensis]